MEKMIKEKGITLIALIVTIIVLLILAGVTIVALTGENGILSRTRGATNAHSKASVIEDVQLAWQAIKTEYETREDANKTKTEYYTKDKVANELNSGTISDEENSFIYNENGKSLVVYVNEKNEKYNVQIDENGNVTIIEDISSIGSEDKLVKTTYSAKIKVGETYKITTSESLSWESSDETIATTTASGNEVTITGVKEGETTITGKNSNGTIVNECILTVEKSSGNVGGVKMVEGKVNPYATYTKDDNFNNLSVEYNTTLTYSSKITGSSDNNVVWNSYFDTGLKKIEILEIHVSGSFWTTYSGSDLRGYAYSPIGHWKSPSVEEQQIYKKYFLDRSSPTSDTNYGTYIIAKLHRSDSGSIEVQPCLGTNLNTSNGNNTTYNVNYKFYLYDSPTIVAWGYE